MDLDRLLFEPKQLFQGGNYVSPEQQTNLSISQVELTQKHDIKQLKFQSVQNCELLQAIEGIPMPVDDISMSSLHSYQSMTPQTKKPFQKYKPPTPVDSVLTSLNQQQIVEWSKSNVKPPMNGHIFPQVLAPSIECTNETTMQRCQATFGSQQKSPTDKINQLRNQVKQQQNLITQLTNQLAESSDQNKYSAEQKQKQMVKAQEDKMTTIINKLKEQHQKELEDTENNILHLKNTLDQQKIKYEQDIKKVSQKIEKDMIQSVDAGIKRLSQKHQFVWDATLPSISQLEIALDRIISNYSKQMAAQESEIKSLRSEIQDLECLKVSQKRLTQLEDFNKMKSQQCESLEYQLKQQLQKYQELEYEMSQQQVQSQQQILALQKQLDSQSVSNLKKSKSDTKMQSFQLETADSSKNFMDFIHQLMQRIQTQEAELQQLKKGESRQSYTTFVSQNVRVKTQEDEELNPELMSDDETIQVLLRLLSRISKSRHMQRLLRRNKDFQHLIKHARERSEPSKNKLTSVQSPQSSREEIARKLMFTRAKNKTMVQLK